MADTQALIAVQPKRVGNPSKFGNAPQLPFHFSAYWGTWSRVLLLKHHGYQTVELNLTPIPGCGSSRGDWDEIRHGIIRVHNTPLDRKDKEVRELPAGIMVEMGRHIGAALTMKLCRLDLLPMIDPAKLGDHRNQVGGGVPIQRILRDGIRWAH